MDYEAVQAILSSIFAEEMSPRIARHWFLTRKQDPNESIVDFASALWTLAINCDFGMMEDEVLTSHLCASCCHRNAKLKLLQQNATDFESSVKLAISVGSVLCIGSGDRVLTSESVSSSVQTEPCSCLVLQKCCNMQTDSVSSIEIEQTHTIDTQTNPVLVLVSQCTQMEPVNELDRYPVRLPQIPSLTMEETCLEWSHFSSTGWLGTSIRACKRQWAASTHHAGVW